MELKIDNKYTIVEDLRNGVFKATRYGEEWRNLVGDNLILAMVSKIEEMEKELEAWRNDHMI
jgi:hypothetical protein